MIAMCLKDLLVVFRGYFVDILQVIEKYFESIKNWILTVEYLYLSGICKVLYWVPKKVDFGAPSWKSQRSRWER